MHGRWVKLYKKAIWSEVRRSDPTAWRVFETLLLLADSDGKWSGGRYQLAEADGVVKPSTIYKALTRLRQRKMVTLSGNTRYTEVSICNWAEYQDSGNTSEEQRSNSKVAAGEHSYKNKDNNKIINNFIYSPKSQKKAADPTPKYTDEDVAAAERLRALVHQNYPFLKAANPERDYVAINRLHRIDNRPYPLIAQVIDWCQKDSFWRQNIRSATTLREKFDTLLTRMVEERKAKGK